MHLAPTAGPTQEQVKRLEGFLLQCPQTDLGTQHHILKTPLGTLYARQITAPAGVIITGAACGVDHLVTVQGDITVSTDEGMTRLTGQHTFTARAGRKRVGMTHAETTWTTFQIVKGDTLEQIEDEITDEADMLLTRRGLLPFDVSKALEGA